MLYSKCKYIFVILLIIYFFKTFNIREIPYYKVFDGNEIFQLNQNETYLKVGLAKKFNSYIKLCFSYHLINLTYSSMEKPKISVIMPIYNAQNYLYYSLSSIENQNMKDIEIILIDDCSTDNSVKLIEKFMRNDNRIKLIKNKKNKNILYSKSIGTLNSNGEYIMELDQDDMFIRDDIFQILYTEAKNKDLDLVQSRDFFKSEFAFEKKTLVNKIGLHYIHPKKSHYKEQPELFEKLFTDNNNYLLWGLLIKADLYKKAIYNLWPLIISYKINFNEDYIITSMVAQLSKKYKYLNKFSLIHLFHGSSVSTNFNDNFEYYISFYFYIYYLYEYFVKNSPKYIEIIINYLYTDSNHFTTGKNLFPEMFDNIMKIIIKSDYLSITKKQDIFKDLKINFNNYMKYIKYEYLMNKTEFDIINIYQNTIKNEIKINKLESFSDYKISIIIYCTEYKLIDITINSILNQINKDNEIIIIYDNYDETNLKFIKEFISPYNNIKIINNNKNKGILYSYSIGVLNSKGKYILTLQPGYTLAKNNILSTIYNIIVKEKLDILEFNLLINNDEHIKENSFEVYKCLHFEKNRDMELIKINIEYKDIDQNKELLFNKLIKTRIYKKIINKYKLNEYKMTVYNYYDNIFMFLFNTTKAKFKHIDEYGVIKHGYHEKLLKMNNITKDKNILINDSIFYINFLFDKSNNTIVDKKKVLNEFINILSVVYNKFEKINDNSIELIEKFNNSKFIEEEDKIELQFLYNSLIN